MSAQEQVADFVAKVVKDMGLSLEAQVETTAMARASILPATAPKRCSRAAAKGCRRCSTSSTARSAKQLGDQRLLVDCMDFRRGKDNELRQMAKFLAEKAKTSGIEQSIGPLNAYERRLVHLAVAEVPGVTSESIGDAAVKTVTITAKKR